jgi:hypothetical protein
MQRTPSILHEIYYILIQQETPTVSIVDVTVASDVLCRSKRLKNLNLGLKLPANLNVDEIKPLNTRDNYAYIKS